MKIEMIVEKTKTGYSAYAEKYPVCTVGKSLEELKTNILEVVNLLLEKQCKKVTENDLRIIWSEKPLLHTNQSNPQRGSTSW